VVLFRLEGRRMGQREAGFLKQSRNFIQLFSTTLPARTPEKPNSTALKCWKSLRCEWNFRSTEPSTFACCCAHEQPDGQEGRHRHVVTYGRLWHPSAVAQT
jgi:hypothetical protein